MYFFARHVLVTGASLIANLYIIKLLKPGQLGYVAVVNIFICLITIISDGGLTVYLIKHNGEVDESLAAYFFRIQVKVYGALLALLLLVYSVFWVLAIKTIVLGYLCVIALSVIPALLRGQNFVALERELDFRQIAYIEIVESATFSAVSVVLAFLNFGVWSIIVAYLIKTMAGLLITPTPFRILGVRATRSTENRKLLGVAWRFGIGYHATSVVGVLRNIANPSIMGLLYGSSVVGACDRSTYIAGIPCSIVGTIQNRILFPFYSLIQNKTEEVVRVFNRSIFISGAVDKLLYIPIIITASYIPQLLGPEWIEAKLIVQVIAWGNLVFGVLISSCNPFLAALGKPQWLARLSVVSTLVSWLLLFPFAHYFGQIGYAYISVINWFPLLVMVYAVCRHWEGVRVVKNWLIPVIAASIAVYLAESLGIDNQTMLVAIAGKTFVGLVAYITLLFLLGPARLTEEVRSIIKHVYVHSSAADQ